MENFETMFSCFLGIMTGWKRYGTNGINLRMSVEDGALNNWIRTIDPDSKGSN
jgi:hypothetical protein